jgi:transcriptional regulator with XRE-family HTH domain
MDWDKALRRMEELDISMYRLSIELGKDSGQVKNWVTRRTTPQGDSLIKMAKILNVRPEWFFPEEFPNIAQESDRRRKFHAWVDDMTEEELKSIVELFEVFNGIGKKLGR